MKKIYALMAVGAMMAFSSCSQEDLLNDNDTDGMVEVSISATLPTDIRSRVTATGANVTDLDWFVFDSNGKVLDRGVVANAFSSTDCVETLKLKFQKGSTYIVAFWTDSDNSPYTLTDTGYMTIDVDKCYANDEDADAFYGAMKVIADGTLPSIIDITLHRPFAQINFGATDISGAMGQDFSPTGLIVTDNTLTGAYTRLQLYTGYVDQAVAKLVYKPNPNNPLPNSSDPGVDAQHPSQFTLHGNSYNYIVYAYMLTSEPGDLLPEVQFTTSQMTSRAFTNVPVKQNYRTNIMGDIFSATSIFDINIEPAFDDDEWKNIVTTPDALANAIAAGGEITLGCDIKASEAMTIPAGKEVTINLNGNKIVNETKSGANRLLFVVRGTLTINGEGTIDGGEGGNNQAVHVVSGGKAVLNGGTYTVGSDANGNGNACIEAEGTGQIEINGGHYSCKSAYAGKYFVLNGHDNSPVAIVVKGGSFVNCNPAATGLEPAGQNDNWVAAGYHVETTTEGSNTIYTVVAD